MAKFYINGKEIKGIVPMKFEVDPNIITLEFNEKFIKHKFVEIKLPYYFHNENDEYYIETYGVILSRDKVIIIKKITHPFSSEYTYVIENTDVFIFDTLYKEISKTEFDKFKLEFFNQVNSTKFS